MPGFKFRLQKILEHRETLENIKKGEFSKAQAELNLEIEKLEELENSKQSIFREKQEKSQTSTTMNELQKYNNYLIDLDRMMKLQAETIELVKEKVEKARKELIEATKDKKIIEKLRVRDYQEFLYEEKIKEEKANDQFVSYSSSTNVMGD